MRPSSRRSGAEETRTGAPGVDRGGGARGAGRARVRAEASKFSSEVGLTRVRATIDSLGNASCLMPLPVIVRSSILMEEDVVGPPLLSPLGESSGAAENWAGREPWGTTGSVLMGFNPTTAALRLDGGAAPASRAGAPRVEEDEPARRGGGANTLGCGRSGSEPGVVSAATVFGFEPDWGNAGAEDRAGDGPVRRATCCGGTNAFGCGLAGSGR